MESRTQFGEAKRLFLSNAEAHIIDPDYRPEQIALKLRDLTL